MNKKLLETIKQIENWYIVTKEEMINLKKYLISLKLQCENHTNLTN